MSIQYYYLEDTETLIPVTTRFDHNFVFHQFERVGTGPIRGGSVGIAQWDRNSTSN
ncbi:hypothetical protein NJ7G_3828 [Natrinema sp. J7-2]|uniref:Uncharacterized protein n=1 Tax=Natrinema gari JCM 14663 TaxID=1230459 RepID=L9YVT1_9EURY|nr:hypothetical protein NJ7G_3828 [Natrinema sp. J7-2]ELY77572.1 hypothetical protein C486_15749 [Natrinema gari JCM 14663]